MKKKIFSTICILFLTASFAGAVTPSGRFLGAGAVRSTDLQSGTTYTMGGLVTGGNLDVGGDAGIGTDTPGAKLDVRQAAAADIVNIFDGGTEVFTILDGGNVGIGTTNPGSAFSIYGDTLTVTSTGLVGIGAPAINYTLSVQAVVPGAGRVAQFRGLTGQAGFVSFVGNTYVWDCGIAAGSNDFMCGDDGPGATPTFQLQDDNDFIINNGDLGIGTTNPSATLEVNNHAANDYAMIVSSANGTTYMMAMHSNGQLEFAGTDPTLGTCANGTIHTNSSIGRMRIDVAGANSSCVVNLPSVWHGVPICTCSTVDAGNTSCQITALTTTVLTLGVSAPLGAGDAYLVMCDGMHTE